MKTLQIEEYKISGIVEKKNISTIIAAAGRGTRLGYAKPKILYLLNDKTILEILLEKLYAFSSKIIIVTSPDGYEIIQKELRSLNIDSVFVELLVQNEPTGMADAVEIGLKNVDTDFVNVVWGDQVGLQLTTMEKCIEYLIENSMSNSLCLPLVKVNNPYVHFELDEEGKLTKVLLSREGDNMPEFGMSDCGFFSFKTIDLKHLLSSNKIIISEKTSERNLITLFPKFEYKSKTITGLLLNDIRESYGINSIEDVNLFLKNNC